MAENIYTYTTADPFVPLHKDHSDIRRESVEHTNEIIKEGIKGDFQSVCATKDAAERVSEKSHNDADRILQRETDYFIATQNRNFDTATQLSSLKATTDMGMQRIQFDIQAGIDRAAAATALESAKVAAATALESAKIGAAVALGQAQLERTINADGNETRRLINELKVSELERKLIERNAEALEWRGEARHWRGFYDNSQFNNLVSQMNSFQSQLQETRQGLVNFGNMAGVGQSSTSNNVR